MESDRHFSTEDPSFNGTTDDSEIPPELASKIIDYNDINFGDEIGYGAYGEVFKGSYKNFEVAIKKLFNQELSSQEKESFRREVTTLAQCSHQFLLPFVGYTNVHPYCILTTFISGKSLYSNLHETTKPLNSTQKTIIAYGIASGMDYLHKKHLIHRDLKTQNILLYPNKMPVICDFGSSRQIVSGGGMTALVGTPQYMAPEFLADQSYNSSVDVYSYGVILWEMATDCIPFDGLQAPQVVYQVMSHRTTLKVPEEINAPLANLIRSCLSEDPEKRPTFSEIKTLFSSNQLQFDDTDFSKVQPIIDKDLGISNCRKSPSDNSVPNSTGKLHHHSTKSNDESTTQDSMSPVLKVPKSISQMTHSRARKNSGKNSPESLKNVDNPAIISQSPPSTVEKIKIRDKLKRNADHDHESHSSWHRSEMVSFPQLLHIALALIFKLKSCPPDDPSEVLSFFEEHYDSSQLSQISIWKPFFEMAQRSSPAVQSRTYALLSKISRIPSFLNGISYLNPQTAASFLEPGTLDIFSSAILNIKSFATFPIVQKLIQLASDSNNQKSDFRYSQISALPEYIPPTGDVTVAKKCIVLLYKIFNKSEKSESLILIPSSDDMNQMEECSIEIINFFKRAAMTFSNLGGGGLILRVLSDCRLVTPELISAYGASQFSSNVIAAYDALFALRGPPSLFKLSNVLNHSIDPNPSLRGAAREFLRTFAHAPDGQPLSQMAAALSSCAAKFGDPDAVFLSCRYASDGKRCRAYVAPQIADVWLSANQDNARFILPLFLVICKSAIYRPYLFAHRLAYDFLANALVDPPSAIAVAYALGDEFDPARAVVAQIDLLLCEKGSSGVFGDGAAVIAKVIGRIANSGAMKWSPEMKPTIRWLLQCVEEEGFAPQFNESEKDFENCVKMLETVRLLAQWPEGLKCLKNEKILVNQIVKKESISVYAQPLIDLLS